MKSIGQLLSSGGPVTWSSVLHSGFFFEWSLKSVFYMLFIVSHCFYKQNLNNFFIYLKNTWNTMFTINILSSQLLTQTL